MHAEIHALLKFAQKKNISLHNKRSSKKTYEIDICVVRTNNSGDICNSKPCWNCVCEIYRVRQYGIIVKNISYSTESGAVIKRKFKDLLTDEKHVSRFFRQQHKKNIK